jgi:hypothetical protein
LWIVLSLESNMVEAIFGIFILFLIFLSFLFILLFLASGYAVTLNSFILKLHNIVASSCLSG